MEENATTRSRHEIGMLALLLACAMALMMALAGCQPQTLESYFNQHSDEWQQVQDAMDDVVDSSGGVISSCDLKVEDNHVTMSLVLSYDEATMTTAGVTEDTWDEALSSQMDDQIDDLKEESGIDGISWTVDIQSSDGATLFNKTYEGNN